MSQKTIIKILSAVGTSNLKQRLAVFKTKPEKRAKRQTEEVYKTP
jgi:hypothetical protein